MAIIPVGQPILMKGLSSDINLYKQISSKPLPVIYLEGAREKACLSIYARFIDVAWRQTDLMEAYAKDLFLLYSDEARDPMT